MALRINLNTAAYQAHRTLTGTDSALGKSIEKLSSGFRINSAGDDPAGLIISEKLRAQVGGISMAIKNAGDAVNMVKTAEGALSEVHRLLRSMRDLAVHASNTGANDGATAAADQQQITNAISSINKIAAETQFGNKKLLDGTAGITASVAGTRALSGDFSNVSAVSLTEGAKLDVTVLTAAERALVNTIDFGTDGATVVSQSGSFTINGVSIDYTSGTDNGNSLIAKINAKSDQTGVMASMVTAGQITLQSVAYGSEAKITVASSSSYIFGATSANDAGVDVGIAVQLDGGTTDVSDAIWSAGDGLIAKDSKGNSVVLTEDAGKVTSVEADEFVVSVGTLKFQVGAFDGQTRDVNISSVASSQLGTTAVAGKNVSNIDVSTFAGAQDAIKVLDAAISQVSGMRATLGATQRNVLESSINSLSVAKENIQASESTIRDTDMAAEMVEFTKLQILQQSGISMLAQANSGPQALLSLLRG